MNDEQRDESFNRLREHLENEGYTSEKQTISVVKANVMALITAGPVAILLYVLFFLFTFTVRAGSGFKLSLIDPLLFLLLLIATIFAHEFIHGITWSFYCKDRWKSIHIGVMRKQFYTPFCCCTEPLNRKAYLLGGLMPLIVLGFGLFVAAVITGSLLLASLAAFNVLAAGGDITIALMLLKTKSEVIIDHPTQCGFYAFYKKI